MEAAQYSSIFKELTKRVQLIIDEASRRNKVIFGTPVYPNYLTWDTPQIDLNFEEIIGEYGLAVAATTIGEDSKEPIRNNEGFSTLKAKVFHHAHTYPLTVQEYRKVLSLLNSRLLTESALTRELVNIMWGSVEKAVNGVQDKLDMIFLGALSNEGKYQFNESNNPEGVKGSVDYKMPEENKGVATVEWTERNIANVDPFEDIQKIADAAQNKTVLSEIWISQDKLSYILRSKKLKQVIFGTDKINSPLLISSLNEFMRSNLLPTFKVINRQTRIQQKDGTLVPHIPFNGKNIVFVPAGSLGIIKNAYTNNELKPESDITYSNYDRIRISQWGVGEKQNSNITDFTKAECIALPVFNSINAVFSLKTES